jgi:hypothetical protein
MSCVPPQSRLSRAWKYNPATQTASVTTVWEELAADGWGISRIERQPARLDCVFRFKMEHLLRRVGLVIEAVYGDFFKSELTDQSKEMIRVARLPPG